MIPITAIILTKDEEAHIAACIESVRWADEVLVVDSLSTDRTLAIAQECGARVVTHPFENYAAQRNFAQAQATHDWVLHVDADERVTPELRVALEQLRQGDELTRQHAFYIGRVDLCLGVWIPRSPDNYRLTPAGRRYIQQTQFIRFYDRRHGRWTRALHEVVEVAPPHGFLDGCLVHYSVTNLHKLLEPFNSYTDLEAAYLYAQGQRSGIAQAIFRGVRLAVYLYTVRSYYRFGAAGLVFALHQGYVKYMNYLKLWELHQIAQGRGMYTDQDRARLPQSQ